MKLNKRLNTLFDMVEYPYDRVWDCCCDHGLLGYHFLLSGHIKYVHFLDIVPSIIKQLKSNLLDYTEYIAKDCHWTVHCCDVADIPLITESSTNESQLIIISGVGGEIMCQMISAIKANNPEHQFDFLLSPIHHSYKLRKYLTENKYLSIKEYLIHENNRFYEALLVSEKEGDDILPTGGLGWETQIEHQQYILKLVAHYQRVIKSNKDMLTLNALSDYQTLYEQFYGK